VHIIGPTSSMAPQTWQQMESNCFLHVLYRDCNYIVFILKTHKRCTLKILNKFYFHIICVVQCFPHIFHIVSMHFSYGNNTNPSINVICVKRTQILLSYQVQDGGRRRQRQVQLVPMTSHGESKFRHHLRQHL
jgi:hypothetical protein